MVVCDPLLPPWSLFYFTFLTLCSTATTAAAVNIIVTLYQLSSPCYGQLPQGVGSKLVLGVEEVDLVVDLLDEDGLCHLAVEGGPVAGDDLALPVVSSHLSSMSISGVEPQD